MKSIYVYAIASVFLITACANPDVVSKTQYGDNSLSCEGIKAEIRIAEKFKSDAKKEKGVTGTNAAAVLFFWPALFLTYSNVNEAVDAAEDRIGMLMNLGKTKKCSGL